MRIAIFSDTFFPTKNGIVDCVWRVAKGLKKAGHKVHLFVLSNENSDEVVNGVVIHRFKAKPFLLYEDYLIRFMPPIRRIFKIAKKERFNVIHSNLFLNLGFCALLLSKIKKIPLVTTFHTLLPHYIKIYVKDWRTKESHKKPISFKIAEKLRIDNLIFKATNKLVWWWLLYHNLGSWITTPSNYSKDILRRNGLDSKKMVVVPNPIEPGSIKKKKRNKVPLILHVGRLSLEKRVDVLIKSLKYVKQDFKCVIASEGPLMDYLKNLAKKEGVADKIRFTGFISNEKLMDYYNRADVLVSPAIHDTFNNCVAEALAHKTPVIISNKSGAKDFVKHGADGLIVKRDNPKEYASHINSILKEKKLKPVAKNVRDYTDTKNIVDKLLTIYKKPNKTKRFRFFKDFLKYGLATLYFYGLILIGELFEKLQRKS